MLALARAYIAVHDRELEHQAIFDSRVTEIVTKGPKPSA